MIAVKDLRFEFLPVGPAAVEVRINGSENGPKFYLGDHFHICQFLGWTCADLFLPKISAEIWEIAAKNVHCFPYTNVYVHEGAVSSRWPVDKFHRGEILESVKVGDHMLADGCGMVFDDVFYEYKKARFEDSNAHHTLVRDTWTVASSIFRDRRGAMQRKWAKRLSRQVSDELRSMRDEARKNPEYLACGRFQISEHWVPIELALGSIPPDVFMHDGWRVSCRLYNPLTSYGMGYSQEKRLEIAGLGRYFGKEDSKILLADSQRMYPYQRQFLDMVCDALENR